MLLKKIYILKGENGEKGVLKTTRLEGRYFDFELTVHEPIRPTYLLSIKCGSEAEVIEIGSKYKKRLSDGETLYLTVAESTGKILFFNHYSKDTEKAIEDYLKPDLPTPEQRVEDDVQAEKIEEANGNENERAQPLDDERNDVTERFGISEVDTKTESTDESDKNDFVKEFEEKYPTATHNEELENLAEGSKWIITDDGVNSVGLLYNSTGATHVCYALKGEREDPPSYPAEWLDGFWVLYKEL